MKNLGDKFFDNEIKYIDEFEPNQLAVAELTRKNNALEVGEFLDLVNIYLEQLNQVEIKGEIGEVGIRDKVVYFTLKDSTGREAVLQCLVWRWRFNSYSHLIKEGMEVVVRGSAGIYEKKGQFRFITEYLEPVGEGSIKKAFEALKKKLAQKGYFLPERKRPIPKFVQRIGIITSEKGRAINDFRKNLGQYGFFIGLYDVRVEGSYAEGHIIKAIEWFNKNGFMYDVLVITRGGGSAEDLKVFNSEKIAEAIISSKLPIITGIGHEQDETIAGMTADLDLSTPTAVAQFLRRQREKLIEQVEFSHIRLIEYFQNMLAEKSRQIFEKKDLFLKAFSNRMELTSYYLTNSCKRLADAFNYILNAYRKKETEFIARIEEHRNSILQKRYYLERLAERIINTLEKIKEKRKSKLAVLSAGIDSLNPENILSRGYSITYTKQGKILKGTSDINEGDELYTKLYKGKIISTIKEFE